MTRVLVVDDEEAAARSTARLLRSFGYHCDTCLSGEEALEPRRTARCDVIILDVGMPGFDGITVCQQLRLRGFDGVIIMLSAINGEDEKARAFAVGADDYVVKPVAGKELDARVRARLAEKLKLRALMEPAVPSSPPSSRTPTAPDVASGSGEVEIATRPIRVLVADPDGARRAHMSNRLAKLGAIVQQAANEPAARSAVEDLELEAALLWSMGRDGDDSRALNLCREMRTRAPSAAIVLISANFEAPSAAVAAAGADLCFPERTPIDTLWFAAASCVHRHRTRKVALDLGRVQILLAELGVVVDGDHRKIGAKEHAVLALLAKEYPRRLTAKNLRDRLDYSEPTPGSNPLTQTISRAKKKLAPHGGVLDWDGGYGLVHTDKLSSASGTRPKQPGNATQRTGDATAKPTSPPDAHKKDRQR